MSRSSSPIASKHPSRSSSTNPQRRSNGGVYGEALTATYGTELTKSLSGLWSKSWTSLQGLASTALGSDASSEMIKDKSPQRTRRPLEATHPPRAKDGQWGPSSATPLPGAGTREERRALVAAKKREDMLKTAGDVSYTDLAARFKRRTSDDYESSSVPPGENDDRDALVYIHRVRPEDTLAGISIRYNCQMAVVKKANRMWSNDGVQTRTTIVLPVDACTVKGKRVPSPGRERPREEEEEDLLCGDGTGDRDHDRETAPPLPASNRPPTSRPCINSRTTSFTTFKAPSSTWVPPSPSSSVKTASGLAGEEGWVHESWIRLESNPVPVEIARMPRRDLAFFPRARRKSLSFSDNDTPSASFELPRPALGTPDLSLAGSPGTIHPVGKPRRSSSSHHFARQLLGPGGVGPLAGKGPTALGPSEDKLTKVLAKNFPGLLPAPRNPSDDDETVIAAASSPGGNTIGLEQMGGAIEGWVRKLASNAAKMVEPAAGAQAGKRGPGSDALGLGQGRGAGDLIELNDAFEIGIDEDEEIEERHRGRGRPDGSTWAAGQHAVVKDRAYFGLREDEPRGGRKKKGE